MMHKMEKLTVFNLSTVALAQAKQFFFGESRAAEEWKQEVQE